MERLAKAPASGNGNSSSLGPIPMPVARRSCYIRGRLQPRHETARSGAPIEFGLTIPNRGPMATPEAIRALAARAEESGFVRFAVSDLIVVPKSYASRYPYDVSGKLVGYSRDCLEQLILMTHVAAVTREARILSAVVVVPHRPAVFTAKAVATMDVLSGGRIDLGIGAGWLHEEFEAVGAPDFDARGRVTDEYLEAFRTL